MFRRAIAFGAVVLVALALGLLTPQTSSAAPRPVGVRPGGIAVGGVRPGVFRPGLNPNVRNVVIFNNASYYRTYPFYGGFPYYGSYFSLGAYPYYGYTPSVNVYLTSRSLYTPAFPYSYAPSVPYYYPSYVAPAASAAPAQADAPALITISLPADAEVWFDGTKTSATGAVREYQTPALAAGRDFNYEVTARWTANGREVVQAQKVAVAAGARVNVSFPAPETIPPPKDR